jgi:hypothetical protein
MNSVDTVEPIKRGGFVFAVAAFFGLGATSTIAQMIAWSVAGLPVLIEWSTGGLVAFVASITMWIWCRSWGAWWRWIWLPAAIIIAMTIFLANTAAENFRHAQQVEACGDRKSEMDDLIAQRDALVAAMQDRVANWAQGLSTDWEKFGMSAENAAAIDAQRAQEYYDRNGGPELEARFNEVQSQYNAAC